MSATSFQEAVQAAIYTRLAALTVLLPSSGERETLRVYDHIPQAADSANDASFPYLTVGNVALTELNTDTEEGAELVISVHIWSRYSGKLEVLTVGQAVYNALHRQEQSLAITEYAAVYCEFESGETLVDPDGVTHHGVYQFRVYLDQTE